MEQAFASCESLISIVFQGLTEINDFAFDDCTSLSQVVMKSLTPPKAQEHMFKGCNALTEIIVPTSAVEAYKSATGWSTYASKIVGGAENV